MGRCSPATGAVDGVTIKFEIIRGGRILLEPPGDLPPLCGIATLTLLDTATSKVLANSDRWADEGRFCRDLIDLAMMRPTRALLDRAMAKACMTTLSMTLPRALVWSRIKALRPR